LASPHFLPDGNTTSGSFDLEISAKALRCIYSLPNLPLAAEISVVTSEGRPKIATTLFTEKNGVAKIIVKNFSYSTPKIKIKFTQAQKKISITCTKGKLKKVISGSKPTCPKGYKKTA
jgi:spore coat protein U-like protein